MKNLFTILLVFIALSCVAQHVNRINRYPAGAFANTVDTMPAITDTIPVFLLVCGSPDNEEGTYYLAYPVSGYKVVGNYSTITYIDEKKKPFGKDILIFSVLPRR